MKGLVRSYREIAEDYTFDADIMNGEPEKVRITKYIVNHRLNQVDRTLILLYADCHSYRKLGERMHLSRTTIQTQICRIKAEILRLYEELKDKI